MEREEPRQLGLPIYFDAVDRELPDPFDSRDTDWHPATPATTTLWRCFESMRKVGHVLEASDPNAGQRKLRQLLVGLSVPLYDFFLQVDKLGRVIEGDKQTRDRLDSAELSNVRNLTKRFKEAVLDCSGAVKSVRDKLAAHTDDKLKPHEAASLIQLLQAHEVGPLLHRSLFVLQEFANLDCYAWSSNGYRDGEVRLMTCEPFVWSLRADEPCDLIGFEQTETPKRHVYERIADLVEMSQWMFKEGQNRLVVRRAAPAE